MRLETDSERQLQAGAEAVEVLKQAGFLVGDFGVDTSVEGPTFDLEVELSIPENERPLEEVGACECDECPRAE